MTYHDYRPVATSVPDSVLLFVARAPGEHLPVASSPSTRTKLWKMLVTYLLCDALFGGILVPA